MKDRAVPLLNDFGPFFPAQPVARQNITNSSNVRSPPCGQGCTKSTQNASDIPLKAIRATPENHL